MRQEIAAVARGVAGIEKATTFVAVFSDVTATTPNTWAWASVNPLVKAGLIAENSTFRPEANISKSEGIGMIVKAACGSDYTYDATKNTTWQEQVVSYAVANGITSAFTDYNTSATRGFVFEAAVNAMDSCGTTQDDVLCELLGTCEDDTNTGSTNTGSTNTGTVVPPVVVGGDVEVSLSPESPTRNWQPAATPRTAVLAFDVTAGDTDVTLNQVRLDYTGLSSYTDIDNVKLYEGNNQVSKTSKSFNDKYIELSFENDTVVKAGETRTFTVTAELVLSTNVAHKITLTRLDTNGSATLNGNISSATFNVVAASNIAELDMSTNSISTSAVKVGDTITLADFKLRELNDNEDVNVKSMTFELAGSMDFQNDLSDITLYANGIEVASNLSVNDDDEVVADLDYTIAAKGNATFKLKATVSGSANETISSKVKEVYAVGAETGIAASVDDDQVAGTTYFPVVAAASRNIEGSEINVSFDKSSIDEAKINADSVAV